jgi:hypothetical protein
MKTSSRWTFSEPFQSRHARGSRHCSRVRAPLMFCVQVWRASSASKCRRVVVEALRAVAAAEDM